MTDPVRNYIRRSRPELASYRSKKSFWEKLTDKDEGQDPKKKPVVVPAFGEIKRKFNETNTRRSRSSTKIKETEAAKDDEAKHHAGVSDLPRASTRNETPSPSEDLSRKSSRRRSLEKPKTTLFHQTEVMEGYVPSDTDSAATNKDQDLLKSAKANLKLNTNTSFKKEVDKVRKDPAKVDATAEVTASETSTSIAKRSSSLSSEGSFRKKNRLRRRGSGKESRYDAVKKEDIESARLSPPIGTKVSKDGGKSSSKSSKKAKDKSETDSSQLKLQRQDSGDNPLKRKRDKKLNKAKSLSTSVLKTENDNSPVSPSYEGKGILSGIQLSRPKSLVAKQEQSNESVTNSYSKQKPGSLQINQPELKHPPLTVGASTSQRKQYESVFKGRKLQSFYPVDDGDLKSNDIPEKDYSGKLGGKDEQIKRSTKELPPLTIDVGNNYSLDTAKASDGVDSSSDTPRAFDTVESNCSEHRWSTIDSGISVACALQQNADANKTPAIVQPALFSDDVTVKSTRQRRYRRQSTSSSDSDDDSGISWDELRDFRDVPLVVVDKAPDVRTENGIKSSEKPTSSVKVELEKSIDKEVTSLNPGLKQKSKNASAIGSRINQRWKFQQEDESNDDLDNDLPLRTSTPTGSNVSVVLEPHMSSADSTIIKNDIQESSSPKLKSFEPSTTSKEPTNLKRTPSPRSDDTRQSRLSKFLASRSSQSSTPKPNVKARDNRPARFTERLKYFENQKDNENTKPNRRSYGDFESKLSSSRSGNTDPNFIQAKERIRSKSETAEPDFFKLRSRSLTRQLSPMEDVLTKRSPFRVPSSLSSQNHSSIGSTRRKIPGVSQYQKTHTHSRTSYSNPPAPSGLYRTKSNPILYEPPPRATRRDESKAETDPKPIVRPQDSSLPRKKANPPPVFTPAPPQPTSLAIRLLPQRRRSLHKSGDFESESSFHTPYTTDDENHSDDNSKDHTDKDTVTPLTNGYSSTKSNSTSSLGRSHGRLPSSGVFSESDNEEQTPRKSLAPSLRLRQKVRSRTSSSSSRPMDISFSDLECVDGAVVVRKRRRSRSRTRSTEQQPESDKNIAENDINVHLSSTAAGDRKIDTLDSHHSSQARRQMSLSKTHKTSSKHTDRESDLDNSLSEEQCQGDLKELKHIKDRNNNMISRQNKSLVSLEQLAEEEIISSASKLQIDLYKHKKHFEKDLSKKLENEMEQSDNLVGAIRKSMNEPRAKDKVKEAMKNVSEVIKFDIVRDYRAKLQWYKVEINLGSYTQNVDARKTSNYRVTVSCEMPDGPKFSKDIHLDFPESVDLSQLEILQVGDDLQLRVPFTTWNPPQSMDNVIETSGGDPKDTFSRIGFLEKAYRSMGLQWPPEGATAHYEYLSTREEESQKQHKPPEYQSLIDSGQLKACKV